MSSDIRYPIGPATLDDDLDPARRSELIEQIDRAPAALRAAVGGLDERQLDTPYRPGGWTVRQVVHHVADSHMNAYVRFKLALTEDQPLVKTYEEGRWAELDDARTAPVETSLTLLDTLHRRWVQFLRSMKASDFRRALNHPEHGSISLDQLLSLYGWHGRHHTAHITSLRAREGWH
jgi:uncharacterized damage-inducible protein DinB